MGQRASPAECKDPVNLFQGCTFSRLPGDPAEVSREDEIDMGVLFTQHFLSNNKSEPDVDPGQPAGAAAAG